LKNWLAYVAISIFAPWVKMLHSWSPEH